MFTAARKRAERSGIEFTIERSWVATKLAVGVCDATGIAFALDHRKLSTPGRRIASPWSPSLDRIDNDKGYIPGNVQMVCWMYNQCKNQWKHSDVLLMCRALLAREPEMVINA
jgi:hypothetical protein